jgi:hypothetical protein
LKPKGSARLAPSRRGLVSIGGEDAGHGQPSLSLAARQEGTGGWSGPQTCAPGPMQLWTKRARRPSVGLAVQGCHSRGLGACGIGWLAQPGPMQCGCTGRAPLPPCVRLRLLLRHGYPIRITDGSRPPAQGHDDTVNRTLECLVPVFAERYPAPALDAPAWRRQTGTWEMRSPRSKGPERAEYRVDVPASTVLDAGCQSTGQGLTAILAAWRVGGGLVGVWQAAHPASRRHSTASQPARPKKRRKSKGSLRRSGSPVRLAAGCLRAASCTPRAPAGPQLI